MQEKKGSMEMRNEGGWMRCGQASLAVRRDAGAARRTARRRGLPTVRRRRSGLGLVVDRIQRGGGRIRRLATRGARDEARAPWELLPCEREEFGKGESRVGKGEGSGVAGTCAHSRTQANGSGRRRGSRRRRLSSGGARALRLGRALLLGRSPPTRARHGPPPSRLRSDLHHSNEQVCMLR